MWLNFNDTRHSLLQMDKILLLLCIIFHASLLRGRTLLIELTFPKYHRSEPSDISSGVIFFFFLIFKNMSYLRWYVLYLQGAKLFYLSGLVYGSYPKVEIHNLGRFIAVSKFRPLTWRVSHPYILADR